MGNYQLIAATGCPTGIAHTYMAQEALEQAAKKKGVTIKVETHGQIGIENELTAEEIKHAEAVIIAADKDVHPERFAGKRIIDVSVSTGIKDAERLIDDALAGKGSVAAENQAVDTLEEETGTNTSFGRSIYKNLMNGVSHMLPFVIAGGIMIAISFMVDQFMGVPQDALNQLGSYNQQAAWFNQIGNAAFGFMLPVLAEFWQVFLRVT